MPEKEEGFIGVGWSFPPEFIPSNQDVKMVADEKDIKQSLKVLLSTKLGERVMQPEFGCGIHELVFEELDETLVTYAKNLIEKAILKFEPRIDVDSIHVDEDLTEGEGLLRIDIVYTVRSTNTRSNMVYPFYLKEGTNLKPELQ